MPHDSVNRLQRLMIDGGEKAFDLVPVPSWVVSLPSDLAALAVVAWFYGGGELAGRYSAPALTCSKKCLEKLQREQERQ